jgi:hypothetical protein
MNSNRLTAVIVGALFLTATVTTMLGDSLVVSVLNTPDYLSNMYPNRTQVITGVLIAFIDALAVVGIAVLLFPILKRQNESIALGYVGVRTAEFPILLIWLLSPLLLISLSQEYVKAAAPDASSFQTLGAVMIALRLWSWRLIYIINGVATLLLAFLLYQSRLIPRPISVLGLIGGAVLLAGTSLAMLGLMDVDQGIGMLAVLPGGLFELILPIWLFVKGFNPSVIASEPA